MRFGVCRPITDLASVAALGFDYLEAPATELAAMPEEDFQRVKRQALTVPVRVEALNVLFPGDLRLLAPASEERMLAHASLVFQRGRELGVQTVVFGSGAARSFSEELSFEQAVRMLTGKFRRLGELAAEYGIFIAVEPLRRAESNLINTVAEGGGQLPHVLRPRTGGKYYAHRSAAAHACCADARENLPRHRNRGAAGVFCGTALDRIQRPHEH